MAFWDSWKFLGFTSATYRWSAHALRYGLDRLVPAEIAFDLSGLALHGSPNGMFTIRATTGGAARPEAMTRAEAAG